MWLERLILRKTEKRLLPYREQVESLDVDVKDKYKNYLPQIEKCYTLATHWHASSYPSSRTVIS
jgi:hypothetical protein